MSSAPRHIPHYTVDDFRHWEGDWELIDGVAISMSPSPFAPHERIVTRLARMIGNEIASNDFDCEVYTNLDWIVSNDTVIRPDLMVVCGEQPARHLERPPALMVEVLSDSTQISDRTVKRSIVQENSVRNFLIICPKERTITEASGEDLINLELSTPIEIALDDYCRVQIEGDKLFDAPLPS